MTNLVTIACRLPHGLVIETGKVGAENYRQMKINGPFSKNKDGIGALTVNGYAFTKVPKDFWDEFARTHKTATYLINRAVYAEESDDKAKDASANVGGLTGFEALNPDDTKKNGVEPDKEHAASRLNNGTL